MELTEGQVLDGRVKSATRMRAGLRGFDLIVFEVNADNLPNDFPITWRDTAKHGTYEVGSDIRALLIHDSSVKRYELRPKLA